MTLAPVKEGTKTIAIMESLLEKQDLSVLDFESEVIELERLFENGRFRDKYLLWAVNDSYTCEEIFSTSFPDENIEKGLVDGESRQHNCERLLHATNVIRAVISAHSDRATANMRAVMAYLLWWHRQYGLAYEYTESAYKQDPSQTLAVLMHRIMTSEIPSPNTSFCQG
ncbi:MAG: hypothetical protein IKS49_04430 [Actinomycetaceae bacterium]|nr:hypothetical protein [Actinomycetaceae bacterium]